MGRGDGPVLFKALTAFLDDGDKYPSWIEMFVSGPEQSIQIFFVFHVIDRVQDSDAVESPSQPHGPHIPIDVFRCRVEFFGHCEHFFADIHARYSEMFQERKIIPASPATQVKEGADIYVCFFFDDPAKKFGLFDIIFWWADDRPDPAEVMIKPAGILHGHTFYHNLIQGQDNHSYDSVENENWSRKR
jgi:hypothetical protein